MNTVRYVVVTWGLSFVCSLGAQAQPDSVSRMYTPIQQYHADVQSLNQAFVLKESPEYFNRLERVYNNWLDCLDEMKQRVEHLGGS